MAQVQQVYAHLFTHIHYAGRCVSSLGAHDGSGLGFGLVMAVSGQLYAALGANSYLVMAVIAAIGALAALMLDRRWHGERLTA